jgi:hypothetical protein
METKEAYKEKTQVKIDQLQAEIQGLKVRAADARADAKESLNKQITRLEEQARESQDALNELSEAAAGAWEAVRERIEPVVSSVESDIRDITDRMRDTER